MVGRRIVTVKMRKKMKKSEKVAWVVMHDDS
jgi:hypothetical protein